MAVVLRTPSSSRLVREGRRRTVRVYSAALSAVDGGGREGWVRGGRAGGREGGNAAALAGRLAAEDEGGVAWRCILEEIRVRGNWESRALTTFLAAYGERKGGRAADMALQWLVREGDTRAQNVYAYTAVVKAAARQGEFALAEDIVRRMETEGILPSAVTFNELLNALTKMEIDFVTSRTKLMFCAGEDFGTGRRNSLEMEARRIRQWMDVSGVAPDTVTINLMIRIVGRNVYDDGKPTSMRAVDRARELYSELTLLGLPPNAQTISAIFTLMRDNKANTGLQLSTRELSFLDQLISDAEHHDIEINNHHLSALAPLAPELALKLLREKVRSPNRIAYSSIISALTKAGQPDEAVSVYRDMLANGVEPNWFALSAVVTACRESGDIEYAFEAFNDLTAKNLLGTAASTSRRLRGEWDSAKDDDNSGNILVVYNALLMLCVVHNEMGKALELFHILKRRRDTVPNTESFNAVMTVTASAGDMDRAIELYAEMKENNVPPNEETFNMLLNACAKHRKIKTAAALVVDMVTVEERAHFSTFTALINRCAFSEDKEIQEFGFFFYKSMKTLQVTPTIRTYGCLLRLCAQMADTKRALKLYKTMYNKGVLPNDVCHNSLIRCCSRAGDLDVMMKVVKELTRTRGRFEAETVKGVLRALCGSEEVTGVDRALRVLSLLKIRRIVPDEHTFSVIIKACAETSRPVAALAVYEDMLKLQLCPDNDAFSELIKVLCRTGQLEEALRIYDGQGCQHLTKVPVCSMGALCSIITALSKAGQLQRSIAFYIILKARPGSHVTMRKHPETFDELLEACCRRGAPIEQSLSVFDDMKEANVKMFPSTLAFLLQCCRESEQTKWRMYDICASLRALREEEKMASLGAEEKTCHHVDEQGKERSELRDALLKVILDEDLTE